MTKNLPKPDPADFGFTTFSNLIGKREPIVGETTLPFDNFHDQLFSTLQPKTPYEAVIAENLIAIEWEIFQRRRMRDATLRSMTVTAITDAVVHREKSGWRQAVDAERTAWVAAKEEEDDMEDGGLDSNDAEDAETGFRENMTAKLFPEDKAFLRQIWRGKRKADEQQADEDDDDGFEYEEFDEYAAQELGADLARRVVDPDVKIRSKAEEELIELGLSAVEIMSEAYRTNHRGVDHHDEKIQELERRRRQVKADFDALQKARPVDVEVIEG